jgi:hypothetical protein
MEHVRMVIFFGVENGAVHFSNVGRFGVQNGEGHFVKVGRFGGGHIFQQSCSE